MTSAFETADGIVPVPNDPGSRSFVAGYRNGYEDAIREAVRLADDLRNQRGIFTVGALIDKLLASRPEI